MKHSLKDLVGFSLLFAQLTLILDKCMFRIKLCRSHVPFDGLQKISSGSLLFLSIQNRSTRA